jgi:hypothetical protein
MAMDCLFLCANHAEMAIAPDPHRPPTPSGAERRSASRLRSHAEGDKKRWTPEDRHQSAGNQRKGIVAPSNNADLDVELDAESVERTGQTDEFRSAPASA